MNPLQGVINPMETGVNGNNQEIQQSKILTEEKLCLDTYKTVVQAPEDECYRIATSISKTGDSETTFIHIAPLNEYQELNGIAEKIELENSLRTLVIGDSLSDFYRGYNYVNIVESLLNKYNSHKTIIRNAGVAGDYITRVWERIQGIDNSNGAHKQYMYNNLLTEEPNLVFIFLGSNDTKCSSVSNYKTPLIPPDIQKEHYQKLIEYLQDKTDARIVIIETPAFNSNRCEALAKKLYEKKQAHNRFGIEKAINDFNRVNKAIALKYNLEYLPLFDETAKHPQREQLFQVADGVHLTPMGNRLIAKTILRMFAKTYQK